MADFTELAEIVDREERRKRTAMIALAAAAVGVMVGWLIVSSVTSGSSSSPTSTTIDIPVETMVYPQIIDGVPVNDDMDPTTKLQPTRRNVKVNAGSISMKVWVDQHGNADLAAVVAAADEINAVATSGTQSVSDACSKMASTVADVRSHPTIPDTEAASAWSAALDQYETAAGFCIDKDATVRLEALSVFANDEILDPVRNRVEAVQN